MQLGDVETAVDNMRKAISFYQVHCENKNLAKEEKIESRLNSKLRNFKALVKIKPLKDSMDSDQEDEKREDVIENELEPSSRESSSRVDSKTSFNGEKAETDDETVLGANDTVNDRCEARKKILSDLQTERKEKIEEEIDSDGSIVFKNEIIDINKK